MTFPCLVIRGHTSFDTAFEVNDYPYGSKRTKIRYWLEKADKFSKKGNYRFVSCTLNPKTGKWNKPHASTYAHFAVMYIDQSNGHCEWWGLHIPYPGAWARFFAAGLYVQLDEAEKKIIDTLLNAARRLSPMTWNDWDQFLTKTSILALKEQTWDEEKIFQLFDDPKPYRPTLTAALACVRATTEHYYQVLPV